MPENAPKKEGFITRTIDRIKGFYEYCTNGVWSDPHNTMSVKLIKTLNLTFSAFFNSSIQVKSMALTYTTVLSIVPAFALLIAIGRGFGLQDVLQSSLYELLPSQHQVISTALTFVDSYLKSTTQGIFVGVGIVFLLWTLTSLLSSIEDTFNSIWGVRQSRTIYQKITDYISICLLVPVLMICSSGISVFMSSVIQSNLSLPFLTPIVNWTLELIPFVLCWLAFTLSYYLIPNTKVQFKYAAIAGVFAAIGFQVLQMLFLNGQIYVTKYNAIYGSFAFLPLLLIWLQFSWTVLLTGCMISYSMQNVFTFNLMGDEEAISNRGWHLVAIIVMAVVSKRFIEKSQPMSEQEITVGYYLPIRIVGRVTEKLRKAGLIYDVILDKDKRAISPAFEPDELTVAEFLEKLDLVGVTDFVPEFDKIYGALLNQTEECYNKSYHEFSYLLLKDVDLPDPAKIKEYMIEVSKTPKTDGKK